MLGRGKSVEQMTNARKVLAVAHTLIATQILPEFQSYLGPSPRVSATRPTAATWAGASSKVTSLQLRSIPSPYYS